MSSIEKARNGPGYIARWRDDTGRQRKQKFAKKGDATRFLAGVDADLARGTYVDPRNTTTLLDYAREWAASRPHRPSSARRVASAINNHIAPTRIAHRRLSAIRPSELQAWVTDRSKIMAPSSLRLLTNIMRMIFLAAVDDKIIAESPARKLSLPDHEPERVVPLTTAQVVDLRDATPIRQQAMVVTQAGLGLRIGELLALRRDDVDFLRRTVSITCQLDGRTRERVEPKTPRSRRTIPLPQPVAEALAEHMRQFPPLADGTIFYTRAGLPYRQSYYADRVFPAAVAKAKLPPSTTSHDLRHHYASVLLAAGVSVIDVAERLGHKNAKLVITTYGHLMPNSEQTTRAAIENAWSRALSVPYSDTATR